MRNESLILLGKSVSKLSLLLNRGNGSTWPGHIALSAKQDFIRDMLRKNTHLKIIIVAGTNGKTTTSLLIKTILEKSGKKVFLNDAGANMLNGIASTLVHNSSISSKIVAEYAIFEVDENALPHALKELTPDVLVLLNLFRDQLDRYGEVNAIADRWEKALEMNTEKTTLVLNADDPEIAYLGLKERDSGQARMTSYFGLDDKKLGKETLEHAVDSVHCPNCGEKLDYKTIYFSHLGDWSCPRCKFIRPKLDVSDFPHFPLSGLYNRYNTLAAVLAVHTLGIDEKTAENALQAFKPAFGRQEQIDYKGKSIQLFLSKNPTGFNESLRTIKELGAKRILIALNDRIADGRDVSWIWDTDIEALNSMDSITVTGDRAEDMGLRIKYELDESRIQNSEFRIERNKTVAIETALQHVVKGETLYVLPTYTAMLEIRKILTGKEIL